MLSITDVIASISQNQEISKRAHKSERSEQMDDLYKHYLKSYRKNSWTEYIGWLKKNKFKHSRIMVDNYKKSKEFRKPITIKSFCSFWLAHIPTKDLYYINSYARDMDRRGENFNKWLFFNLKAKK